MPTIDLHTHTRYSHGENSAEEMFLAGTERGLTLQGFSEHSPRPSGYDYPAEYRERLTRLFPDYVREVLDLKKRHPGRVLFGMEMDWIEKERVFIDKAVRAYDFDYLIGSVHFIDDWGFDADPEVWRGLSYEECIPHYENYFTALTGMAASGLFHIAAHPDLIKIFSIDHFRRWIKSGDGIQHARAALRAVRDTDMSLEVSSAGLRKPCREIYPGPTIMRLATEMGIPLVPGSDAHRVADVAFSFQDLTRYASSFGVDRYACVMGGIFHEYAL